MHLITLAELGTDGLRATPAAISPERSLAQGIIHAGNLVGQAGFSNKLNALGIDWSVASEARMTLVNLFTCLEATRANKEKLLEHRIRAAIGSELLIKRTEKADATGYATVVFRSWRQDRIHDAK